MQQHQLIGGLIAVIGIVDAFIMAAVVAPRLKIPAKTKKLIVTINGGVGLAMVVAGVAVAFLGGGD